MDDAIRQVIAGVEQYTASGERLRERLRLQSQWNREDIERLRDGATLMESTRATDSASRSRELTRIMAEFEEARRSLRASVVAAALAEGASVSQIGDIFGVSRQLANRFVKEHRARMA